MVLFKKNISVEKVEEWALVLSASSIPHQVEQEDGEWVIYVEKSDILRSNKVLLEYDNENMGWSPKLTVKQLYRKTFSGLIIAFLLVLFYWFIKSDNSWHVWFKLANASAEEIINGELWRAVTALFIHADNLHIISNVISCLIFCSVVCRLFGFGLGWFLILLSGISGNLLTAFFYRTGHYSVGASTAIFGAVGLIGVWKFTFWKKQPFSRKRAWIYLVVVLVLLGILGAGKNTDILAHLFGAIAGCVIGIPAVKIIVHPLSKMKQLFIAALTVSIVAVSWVFALR